MTEPARESPEDVIAAARASLAEHVDGVRALYADEEGATPCPVCGHMTADPRTKPPCYVPYSGRRVDCPGLAS